MSQPVIQASFNSGEWAPTLYARVDLAKYHSGAALLRNFFVDYRGGATTRPGSRYILQSRSNATVRLIPFQASLGVTYVLEFGQNYIRFYNNGAPVLEAALSITSAASGPPEVFTSAAHGYANGDWVFIAGSYYIIANVTTNTFTLTDLFGNAINTNPFSLPTPVQRVYTLLNSPYLANEVFQIKYTQNINTLILCHLNHPPYALTLNTTLTQPNWTLGAITFGATLGPPANTGTTLNTQATGSTCWVSYIATTVDANGIESTPTPPITVTGTFFGVNYTITIGFTPVTGSSSINIYKSVLSLNGILPGGTQYGFIGNFTGNTFVDTNITPDFAEGPPIAQSPFSGASIATITLTAPGFNFTSVPSVVFSGGTPSANAIASVVLYSPSVTLQFGGLGYTPGNVLVGPAGLTIQVTAVDGNGAIIGFNVIAAGVVGAGSVPANPVTLPASQGNVFFPAQVNLNWSVRNITLNFGGAGFLSTPTVAITGGGGSGATATATLGAAAAGNPTVPAIVQQRLFLGNQVLSPAQFNLSQPAGFYNFNTTFPVAADNAIQAALNGITLNSIKSAVAVSAGLVIFSDKGAWLLNGGSAGAPISATQLVANPQSFSGASDLPPIVTPSDILYTQSKGSIVRDLAYNFYLANYVGADISVLSSHLFFTYILRDWAWAEEPYKVVWAARSDGQMLSLTFVKEQELIAWAQHNTQGSYLSICTVPESTSTAGIVDAIYTLVQRNVNGQTVNYIERFVELTYPMNYKSSWQVDAGIGYNGTAATTFSGAQHLGGQVVTGVADGVVINFTMPTSGTFVFGPGGTAGLTNIASASIVTVGLAFTPTITTLPLDLGEPTAASKRKKISGVSLKVNNTLGLSMCSGTVANLANAQPLPDLIIGNINPYNNAIITGLVTGDARGYLDPDWSIPGQYTITQSNPYPASVLGVIPEIEVGDTVK